MGHLRFGRIYKTKNWTEVVGLLDAEAIDISKIASATVIAADRELIKLGSDPILGYCIWLLTRITWAARGNEFSKNMEALGVAVEGASSTFAFISNLADLIRKYSSRNAESYIFSEISGLSFRQALAETIEEHSSTLFRTGLEDIQSACRQYSSNKQFSLLIRKFFAHFISRTLTYLLNKELSNHIGSNYSIDNINSAIEFNEALRQHSFQSTKILEDFAGGWYSKHNWESHGAISEDEAHRFVAFALRKLRTELKQVGH